MTQPGSTRPGAEAALRLGDFLPYRLSILAESVSRAFARHYERRFGITIPEWRVMAVLGEVPGRSTQEVIVETRMDRVKVSRALIRLDHKGLVTRTRRPGDARAHSLRLNRRGQALYTQIVPLAHRLQAELLLALSPAERDTLNIVAVKLLACADRLDPV